MIKETRRGGEKGIKFDRGKQEVNERAGQHLTAKAIREGCKVEMERESNDGTDMTTQAKHDWAILAWRGN